MGKKINISDFIGSKFSMLTILSKEISGGRGQRINVICDCGTTRIVLAKKVVSGELKSCGCLGGGKTGGLYLHPLYPIWGNIVGRCYNRNHPFFNDYGGRGVEVCKEWVSDFNKFYDWCISNGWAKGLEVDKDIKGDGLMYSPETCSLVTKKVNMNNTRRNRIVNYQGIEYTFSELVEKYDVDYNILWWRLKRGWTLDDALEYAKNGTRGKKVYCASNNTIYNSISEASSKLGIGIQAIWRVCNNITKSASGFKFKYQQQQVAA